MNRVRFAAPLLLLLLLIPMASPAAAQQGTTEIRGKVLDAQGAVLPGVTVVLRNEATGMFRETTTNAEGTYFVAGLVPGRYEITAELASFNKFNATGVALELGKTATFDVTLTVGNLTETVTVSADVPLVDVTSKEVGGNITARELIELPSVNRNFVGFVGLLPGIIPTISTESFGSDSIGVNGTDPRNNNYMLDGGNNNDDVIGQRAGTQARTPIEAVAEFQVITNQFDAEYGRTTGAIINAVTKQGTNAWRGSAFGFFKDASLTAQDYFSKKNENDKPDTKEQQFGGTIGGPVVRNRAHFFLSLERVLIDEGITINIPTRPQFNTTTTEQTRVWNTVVRFDHQLTAQNTWGVRWLREASPQFNQIIGNVTLDAARQEADVDQTVVGTFSSVIGNTSVNTLRASWTREDVAFANECFNTNGRDLAACPVSLQFQNYFTQQDNTAQSRVNDGYQLEDTFSMFIPTSRGDHDVKMGVQFQYAGSRNINDGNLNGTFSFGRSDGPFNPNDPSTYPERLTIRVPGRAVSYNKSTSYAAFVQDKWQVRDNLTLSLGVRYDLEIVPITEIDNPMFDDPKNYPVDKNNIAPRIGFSWNPGGTATSVVRGGFGTFYDKTHFELIGGIYTNTVFATSFTRNFPLAGIDPGPRSGQLPTDPFLVNGPVVNRELLAAMFPSGVLLRNTGASWDNPDRRVPYTHQLTLGYERQLGAVVSVSADYVHAFARDLLISRELNPGLRATTAVTSPLVRQGSAELSAALDALRATYGSGFAPFTTGVSMPVNAAKTDYDAIMMQLEKRYANDWSARVAYTLSYSRGNTTGAGVPGSGFQVLDDLNLDLNEGPTSLDRRHNLVVSGTAIVPKTKGMTFSWVARALSGTPFSLTNANVDPDRNGSQSEPLPAGDYEGVGEDAFRVDNYKAERNGAYGPGFFKLDLRAGYRFNLGAGRTLDASVDVFNVTNRVNFGNPTGNQASANFLVLTDYSTSTTPRTAQFGLRFGF